MHEGRVHRKEGCVRVTRISFVMWDTRRCPPGERVREGSGTSGSFSSRPSAPAGPRKLRGDRHGLRSWCEAGDSCLMSVVQVTHPMMSHVSDPKSAATCHWWPRHTARCGTNHASKVRQMRHFRWSAFVVIGRTGGIIQDVRTYGHDPMKMLYIQKLIVQADEQGDDLRNTRTGQHEARAHSSDASWGSMSGSRYRHGKRHAEYWSWSTQTRSCTSPILNSCCFLFHGGAGIGIAWFQTFRARTQAPSHSGIPRVGGSLRTSAKRLKSG